MAGLGDMVNVLLEKRRQALEAKSAQARKPQQGGMVDRIYAAGKDRDDALKQAAGE